MILKLSAKKGFARRISIMIPFVFFILSCLNVPAKPTELPAEEAAWRAERDAEMRSEESWLTIAGLFWLDEGENTFGASGANKIRLPSDSAPPLSGTFVKSDGKITVEAAANVSLLCRGKQVTRMEIEAGDSISPDILTLGDLRMWVIRRGDRYAVRLRDLKAPSFKNYAGLEYFPPSDAFKIEAIFVPYPAPRNITVEAKIVKQSELISPGTVRFSWDGTEYEFVAFGDEERGTLFIVFGDKTNGTETYDGGRFLDFKTGPANKAVLNFNRAYNPPCAFSDYATCPLPPPQNRFAVRLEAGEKKYQGHN